jgi:hypothetical protein
MRSEMLPRIPEHVVQRIRRKASTDSGGPEKVGAMLPEQVVCMGRITHDGLGAALWRMLAQVWSLTRKSHLDPDP